MTNNWKIILAVAAFFAVFGRAQQIPMGEATGFKSVEYFPPPHSQLAKSKVSGAKAQQMAGEQFLITKLTLETYDKSGKLQYLVTAPQCFYNPIDGTANSPGEIHVRTGDGAMQVDGKGFLWRRNDSSITISNDVRTIFEKFPAVTK